MNLLENEKKYYGLFYIKQIILLFWGAWFFIAFLTNVTDFLMNTETISPTLFHSGDYSALAKVIHVYSTPHYFLNILFSLDVLIEGTSAFLFLIAALCFWKRVYSWQTINIAFLISISLWAVFLLMEEIFIAYSYEATHLRLLTSEMISLLMLHLLPHQ
ncbi:MAG: hypothetical protein ACD_60C00060G0022 [uncultured bacterium]|nr:MAG: hypothetical protein ACD_60C00060G0022 [uncultured bacterium]